MIYFDIVGLLTIILISLFGDKFLIAIILAPIVAIPIKKYIIKNYAEKDKDVYSLKDAAIFLIFKGQSILYAPYILIVYFYSFALVSDTLSEGNLSSLHYWTDLYRVFGYIYILLAVSIIVVW